MQDIRFISFFVSANIDSAMRFIRLILLLAVLPAACVSAKTPPLPAATAVAEPETGIRFPSAVRFSDSSGEYALRLTGVTVRKKWFFKVYAVAHYFQAASGEGPLTGEMILTDGPAKQITIEYVRDVSAQKMTDVLREDFERNTTPAEYSEIETYVEQVLDYFNQPVRRGDVFVLRWLAGGRVSLELNQRKLGQVRSVLFARTLWSIWFGKQAVVDPNALMVESAGLGVL